MTACLLPATPLSSAVAHRKLTLAALSVGGGHEADLEICAHKFERSCWLEVVNLARIFVSISGNACQERPPGCARRVGYGPSDRSR